MFTAWKVSKCGVISDPHFPVFGPNSKYLCLNNFCLSNFSLKPASYSFSRETIKDVKRTHTDWDNIFFQECYTVGFFTVNYNVDRTSFIGNLPKSKLTTLQNQPLKISFRIKMKI